MSENLSRLAQKIDFNKLSTDEKKEGKKEEPRGIKRENGLDTEKSATEESDSKEQPAYQSSQWPWDSVRTKLRFL